MKPHIEKVDWDQVTELACDVVNASAMDDEILQQAKLAGLFALLNDLEAKYGPHPSIIATRGDFTENPAEALLHLQEALTLARYYDDRVEQEEILDSIESLKER